MSEKIKYTDALADYVLANGIGNASLRPMAKAAGTSDRMLVYHYGDKAGVLQAALTEIANRNMQALESALPAQPIPSKDLMAALGMVAQSGAFDPVYAVFFELAAMALRGDKMAKSIGGAVAQHFHGWIVERLEEPDRAYELLAAVEGWGMLKGLGLDAPFPTG